MPKKITATVFQGGSVKGAAYLGALRKLPLNDIKRVAGTSAGSITACLLAMGCDNDRIEELLPTFVFRSVLDDKKGSIPTQSKVLKSVGKIDEGKPVFWGKIPAKPVKIPIACRLLKDNGIYEGEYIRNWIENMIQEQVKIITNGTVDGTNLTFAELHELAIKYPGVFRDLFIVGSNLTTGEAVTFGYNNPDYEDVIISDAVRISMSIPYLFKPHHIYHKIDGERLVGTGVNLWTDGGVYNNYPINCFDSEEFIDEGDEPLQQAEDGTFYNPQVVGFRLVSAGQKGYFEGRHDKTHAKEAEKIVSFTQKIAGANFALQEQIYAKPENIARTVYIDHLNISTLAFNLSEEAIGDLIKSGKKATKDYLAKFYADEIHVHDEREKEAVFGY
jgi:NTE family protein